ncbi:MAG: aminopeptidase [Bacteroidetes bacterium]|nr:MAG: aminopeptidase [Bacteroidota bacterium]
MKALTKLLLLALTTAFFNFTPGQILAQDDADTAYIFETVVEIPVTTVKDQHRSGTCWSFAGISFVEAEVLRVTGKVTDLSEMFIVRNAYSVKGLKYVRMHGSSNFGPGGQGHDVINVMAEYGIAPESVYAGLEIGEDKHNHGELDAVLQGFLDAVIKKRAGKLSPKWFEAYNAILDIYLGPIPASFEDDGNVVNPITYAESLEIKLDDYIEITSYSCYPYFEAVNLEIPDNWSDDVYYNLPLGYMMEVINYALEEGYTICWDGDVSDRGFSHRNGIAILPEKKVESLSGTERERWEKLTSTEKGKELYVFEKPGEEKDVDEAMRQEHFDNYTSTDDHLMHLTGIMEDQHGTRYYVTKNSWDDDSNDKGGYLYMSASYVKLNTVAVMIHKDAVPEKIAEKLGL